MSSNTLWMKYQDDEPMALVRERLVRLDYEAASRVLQEEYRRYREGRNPAPSMELAKAVVGAAIGGFRSPDDILAAVRSLIAEKGVSWLLDGLEGAEKVEALYQLGPDGRFVWRAELPKSGTYYVVPVDPGGTV